MVRGEAHLRTDVVLMLLRFLMELWASLRLISAKLRKDALTLPRAAPPCWDGGRFELASGAPWCNWLPAWFIARWKESKVRVLAVCCK